MKKTLIHLSLITTFIFTGCASKQPEAKIINTDSITPKKEKIKRYDSLFETKRKEVLTKTISGPRIPVRTPDVIVRVLTLPTTFKNDVLHSHSFQFLKVDDGKWILGEYIQNETGVNDKTFTPLKKDLK